MYDLSTILTHVRTIKKTVLLFVYILVSTNQIIPTNTTTTVS